MAVNKPLLPKPPFAPGTFQGDQSRAIERELQRLQLSVKQLRDGRIEGVLALDAPPPGGVWAQGDVVQSSAPARTISASTTFVVWGWQYTDEGSGTLTWAEMRFWESMAAGGGGSFAASSMTATTTGAGASLYAGNAAGELVFRTLQAGSGISISTSLGEVKISATGGGGGFAATSQTATNVGTGVGLYLGNPAGVLGFSTLKAGTDITLSVSGNEVVIGFTGTANPWTAASQTATSTGTGVGVYVGNAAGELTFRKVQAGTGISVTTSGGAIRITGTGGGGGNSITTTVVASAPSGTVAGTLFIPSEGGVYGPRIATGSGWNTYGPLPRLHEVPSTGWTKFGATTSYTTSFGNGTLLIDAGASTTPALFLERNRASVSASYVVSFGASIPGAHYMPAGWTVGIYLGDSALGKSTQFWFEVTGTSSWQQQVLVKPVSSISAAVPTVGGTLTTQAACRAHILWMRVRVDGATGRRSFWTSGDNLDWEEHFSISATNSTSALTLDKVGIVFKQLDGSLGRRPSKVRVISWKEN